MRPSLASTRAKLSHGPRSPTPAFGTSTTLPVRRCSRPLRPASRPRATTPHDIAQGARVVLRPGKLRGSTDKLEEEMPKLDGKIAVITGGNSGIGLATAKVFVKKGARVYITGRRQPELEAAAVLLGPNATPVQGDVSKPADLDRLYGQIRKEVGRVDVVFANAGLVTKAPRRS